MDAPGELQAASNSALVSAEYVRLVRRAANLGISESLSIVSTIVDVDTMLLAQGKVNKVTSLAAYGGISRPAALSDSFVGSLAVDFPPGISVQPE